MSEKKWKKTCLGAVLLIGIHAVVVGANDRAAVITEAGTVSIPRFSLPMSSYASDAAGPMLRGILTGPQMGITEKIANLRAHYDAINTARAERMKDMYPVTIEQDQIAGVRIQTVEPAGGPAREHQGKVLINLHGGAFMWGAGSGELVEAIPIAAQSGMRLSLLITEWRPNMSILRHRKTCLLSIMRCWRIMNRKTSAFTVVQRVVFSPLK